MRFHEAPPRVSQGVGINRRHLAFGGRNGSGRFMAEAMVEDVARAEPVAPMKRSVVSRLKSITPAEWLLVAGLVALTAPTLGFIVDKSWSTESGGHGPIVLVTGLWLVWRLWDDVKAVAAPVSVMRFLVFFVPLLILSVIAKITQIIELEGYFVYATVMAVLYGLIGIRAMKLLWFPLLYMAFIVPPPESLVDAVTNPLKRYISEYAVLLLYKLGYPIGGAGVTIQIGQYQLLVAQACSGLNSLVSLSAISSFYVYLQRGARVGYSIFLLATILPVAVFANFVRVLILILLTYHVSESAAQGFLHNFAGLTLFVTALLTIFAIDSAVSKLIDRKRTKAHV
jgi:exosortase